MFPTTIKHIPILQRQFEMSSSRQWKNLTDADRAELVVYQRGMISGIHGALMAMGLKYDEAVEAMSFFRSYLEPGVWPEVWSGGPMAAEGGGR